MSTATVTQEHERARAKICRAIRAYYVPQAADTALLRAIDRIIDTEAEADRLRPSYDWLHRKSADGHAHRAWAELEAERDALRAALGALRGLASTTHSSVDDTYAMPGAKLRQIIMDAENGTKGDK